MFISGPFAFLKRNVLDAIQKNNGDNKYNTDGFFTIFSLDANDNFINVCLYNWQTYPIKNNVTTININVKTLLIIKFMHALYNVYIINSKVNFSLNSKYSHFHLFLSLEYTYSDSLKFLRVVHNLPQGFQLNV